MSKRPLERAFQAILAGSLLLALAAAGTAIPIPNFSSPDYGWSAQAPDFINTIPAPHGIANDPAYPLTRRLNREPNQFRIADLSNPILLPWARESLKAVNDRIIAGKPGYTVYASCWPLGVPEFLLSPVQPLFFMQTPKEVTMIWQMDQQVRHIYLDVPHSAHPKPSWYGESIGHYEGDTLVVDTIGFNDKSFLDNYRTPHTGQLHVVERYHLTGGGKTLEVNIRVEDPGAFTTPWTTLQRFARADNDGPMLEVPCAENNEHISGLDPMPVADTPDF